MLSPGRITRSSNPPTRGRFGATGHIFSPSVRLGLAAMARQARNRFASGRTTALSLALWVRNRAD